jgi:hypothetical protein
VIIFVQINGLIKVNTLRNSFPGKKCEFVPNIDVKIDWKNDLGKSAKITITTTVKFQKVTNVRKFNILKWLFKSISWQWQLWEEAPQPPSNWANNDREDGREQH